MLGHVGTDRAPGFDRVEIAGFDPDVGRHLPGREDQLGLGIQQDLHRGRITVEVEIGKRRRLVGVRDEALSWTPRCDHHDRKDARREFGMPLEQARDVRHRAEGDHVQRPFA